MGFWDMIRAGLSSLMPVRKHELGRVSVAPKVSFWAVSKVLRDVLVFRLRRLEMANLVAALGIMIALRLPVSDIAVRAVFALLLNLLAYSTNDYCDVEHDLLAGRHLEKTRFLRDNMASALAAQLGLVALLIGIALLYDVQLLVALSAGAGICWLYSSRLKRTPYADVAAMGFWGVAMPLVAFPLDSLLGWSLVVQLGLFSTCFELIQLIRDHGEDLRAGFLTTAVRLGKPRSLLLARGFMLLSAGYAISVLHRYIGLIFLLAPLWPTKIAAEPPALAPDASEMIAAEQYWNRIRLIFGAGWLAILIWVYLHAATFGWIASVHP